MFRDLAYCNDSKEGQSDQKQDDKSNSAAADIEIESSSHSSEDYDEEVFGPQE
jgi:hypothetical protein